MNKERFRMMAEFLGTLVIHEKTGKPVAGEYVHKLTHRHWDFSCTRIGDMSSSELGELPTVFPEYWERKGLMGISYKPKPELDMWAALKEFFDICKEDEDFLFIWGDGNKKKCRKKGLLHQGATRTDVAKHMTRFIREDPEIFSA